MATRRLPQRSRWQVTVTRPQLMAVVWKEMARLTDVNYWQKDKSWFIPADYETPVGNQGGCRLRSQTCGAHLEKMCREEARPKPEGRHRRQSL